MSAWICTRRHIAATARFALDQGLVSFNKAAALATSLLFENVRSVNYRYGEKTKPGKRYTLAEVQAAPTLTPTEALKAVQCLNYQSCECPDYGTTRACLMLAKIRAKAEAKGARDTGQEYDHAPWGIPDVKHTVSNAQIHGTTLLADR